MILSGVGDALGYKNCEWEFCRSGKLIHAQVEELGGVEAWDVKTFQVSDDTVMHLATADALVTDWKRVQNRKRRYISFFGQTLQGMHER